MKVSVFVLIVFAMVATDSAAKGERRYCGRMLANVLANFCPEVEEVEKRSGEQNTRYGWQWPNSLSGAKGKRGVVDDCCYKPCSLDDLLLYC